MLLAKVISRSLGLTWCYSILQKDSVEDYRYMCFHQLHLFSTAICCEFDEETDLETEMSCCTPRWWFQRFLIFGEMIQFDVRIFFQIGLAKPPTRHWLSLVSQSSLFPVTTFFGFWVGHGGWRWKTTYAQAST